MTGTNVSVVADDLTGACDSAVAFARRGRLTEIAIDWRVLPQALPEVLSFSTESRDIPESEAVGRLNDLLDGSPWLTQQRIFFKKIDSVLRGNTFAEIAAVVDRVPHRLVLIAPAFPALGRTSAQAVLHIRDIAGERRIDAGHHLAAAGLQMSVIGPGMGEVELAHLLRAKLSQSERVVYCDATSEVDLHTLVRAAGGLGGEICWIGSGGLADALASHLCPEQVPAPIESARGSVLFFVGSNHPVTLVQLEALRRSGGLQEYAPHLPATSMPGTSLSILFEISRGETSAEQILAAVRQVSPQRISCMFMTGGDTATLVCRAFGIQSLRLQTEFAPGLPLGIAVGGPFAGTTVILKSGGFGDTAAMCRVAETFSATCRTSLVENRVKIVDGIAVSKFSSGR